MTKPRGYIHFRSGYDYWNLHIGKFVLPMGVFFIGYLLIAALITGVAGIFVWVTGVVAWMWMPVYFLGLLVVLAIIAALFNLLAWMGRYTREQNGRY